MTQERIPVSTETKAIGAWHKVLQPHIDRFHIAATFDQEVVLNNTGCAAMAALLRDMAERLDCNYPRLIALEREAGRLEGLEEAAAWHEAEAARLSGAIVIAPPQAPRFALMRDVVFQHQWSAERIREIIAALPHERPEAPT